MTIRGRMTLKALYQKFEGFQCAGKCQAYCGPVVFSKEEEKAAGETIQYRPDGSCQFLSVLGTCRIYENRPFLCRAFGAIDTPLMRCPHGCKPILTEQEGLELKRQYHKLVKGGGK